MSRYETTSGLREASYGYDAPTGGYFMQIFYTDEEIDQLQVPYEEMYFDRMGLTLTELVKYLDRANIDYDLKKLINDYYVSGEPTPLQQVVGVILGYSTMDMLGEVAKDITENWSK